MQALRPECTAGWPRESLLFVANRKESEMADLVELVHSFSYDDAAAEIRNHEPCDGRDEPPIMSLERFEKWLTEESEGSGRRQV